jgi:hypothetical protein
MTLPFGWKGAIIGHPSPTVPQGWTFPSAHLGKIQSAHLRSIQPAPTNALSIDFVSPLDGAPSGVAAYEIGPPINSGRPDLEVATDGMEPRPFPLPAFPGALLKCARELYSDFRVAE